MSKKKLKHDAATTKSGTPDTVSASSVGKHKSKNKMSTNAVSTSLKIRKSQAMTTGNVNEVYSSNTTTTTILSINISSLSSKSGDTRPLDFLKSLFGKNIDPNILVVSCAGFLILTIVLCCIVVVYYRRRLKKVAKDKVSRARCQSDNHIVREDEDYEELPENRDYEPRYTPEPFIQSPLARHGSTLPGHDSCRTLTDMTMMTFGKGETDEDPYSKLAGRKSNRRSSVYQSLSIPRRLAKTLGLYAVGNINRTGPCFLEQTSKRAMMQTRIRSNKINENDFDIVDGSHARASNISVIHGYEDPPDVDDLPKVNITMNKYHVQFSKELDDGYERPIESASLKIPTDGWAVYPPDRKSSGHYLNMNATKVSKWNQRSSKDRYKNTKGLFYAVSHPFSRHSRSSDYVLPDSHISGSFPRQQQQSEDRFVCQNCACNRTYNYS